MIIKRKTEFFRFMEESHMRPSQLAKRLGLTPNAIYNWQVKYWQHPTISLSIEHEKNDYWNVTEAYRVETLKK